MKWLRLHGYPFARRLAKEGARDKGDVTLGDGFPLTIQCKDRKGFELAETQRGLKDQMANAGVPWGFAIHKKRGTTDVGQYYAVLPVTVLNEIIKEAMAHRAAQPPVKKRIIPRRE